MAAEYTKGELYTLPNYPDTVHAKTGSRGRRICDTTSFGSKAENEANARRIAACWNACEGISTTSLEVWSACDHMGPTWEVMIKQLGAQRDHFQSLAKDNGQVIIKTACELGDVKAQRDELLAALLMVKDAAIEQRGLDFNLTTEQWVVFHAAITKATGVKS